MPHLCFFIPLSATDLRACDCGMLMHYLLLILQDPKYLGIPLENNEQIKCLKYLVNALHPFLRAFIRDQTIEKEMEAKIKGIMHTILFHGLLVIYVYPFRTFAFHADICPHGLCSEVLFGPS